MKGLKGVLKTDHLDQIQRWAYLWNCPTLPDGLTIEFSPLLSRSLGLAYPARNLIRLNQKVLGLKVRKGTRKEASLERLIAQVLCHEAAHIAVFLLHGPDAKPHGPEWKGLIRKAGYDPARTLAVETISPKDVPKRPSLVYIHRCPGCGSTRTARRAMRSWRCVECVENGLSGNLEITTRPANPKVTLE